ncbi:MAG: hypothetical protein IJP79_00690 [Paludibacteraceae bacterium]|nr:hypothetical protein [Paludibacteraceae bacterium]
MGKAKVVKNLLFFFSLFIGMSSYAKVLSDLIRWETLDDFETVVLKDKEQVEAWAKEQLPFSMISYSKDFLSNERHINIIKVLGCSGMPCCNIYIFVEEEGMWYLTAKTELSEMTTIDIGNDKIIIRSGSSNAGDLPFEALKISDESRRFANAIEHIEELGKDSSNVLNNLEGTYLNCRFKRRRGNFDFTGKSIVFLNGDVGKAQTIKKVFFDRERNIIHTQGYSISGAEQLIIFDNEEAKLAGCDAVIIELGTKPISRKNVIKRLKKK